MLIDSRKKFVLLAFELLFLLVALLIISRGESSVTRFVCALFGHLVKGLIVLSGLLGMVCSLSAIWGILWTERRNLATLEANIDIYRHQPHCLAHAKAIRDKCEVCVKDLQEKKGFQWLVPGHLYNRLRALGVERAPELNKADRAGVPEVQDLHEMTLQSELSRSCSSMMNTIISVLLILGILGTLTAVHGVIQTRVRDVNELAPALEPSQWAVLCTVMLLIARGFYLCLVDRYVYRLDKLTIECLRPALSIGNNEDSESEQAMQEMEQTLQTLGTHSRNAWSVIPFADFSGLAEKLTSSAAGWAKFRKSALKEPETNEEECPTCPKKSTVSGINTSYPADN